MFRSSRSVIQIIVRCCKEFRQNENVDDPKNNSLPLANYISKISATATRTQTYKLLTLYDTIDTKSTGAIYDDSSAGTSALLLSSNTIFLLS